MSEEEKKIVDVEVSDKGGAKTETKTETNSADHDHHRAIHGFGTAAHYMFKPGIIASSITFGLGITFSVFAGILALIGREPNVGFRIMVAFTSLSWSLFGLFIQVMIAGIVFHCLTRHFKADDPNWKDKVDNDEAY